MPLGKLLGIPCGRTTPSELVKGPNTSVVAEATTHKDIRVISHIQECLCSHGTSEMCFFCKL
jgi:hypothetical protein